MTRTDPFAPTVPHSTSTVPPPAFDSVALRELIEALEEHAAGRPLPRGMDRYDLVDLAKKVRKQP